MPAVRLAWAEVPLIPPVHAINARAVNAWATRAGLRYEARMTSGAWRWGCAG
jgi:hypothetical protein